MKKFLCVILIIFISFISFFMFVKEVRADNLSDNIDKKLEELDLTSLEGLFNENVKSGNISFKSFFKQLLNGENSLDYSTFFNYIFNDFFNKINNYLPCLFILIAITFLLSLFNEFNGKRIGESIDNAVYAVSSITVILLIFPFMNDIFELSKSCITNMSKLSEILSPITLTLMLSSGENSKAAVYRPTSIFFTNGVLGLFIKILLPIIFLTIFFSFLSSITDKIDFSKFVDFFGSVIKWMLGIFSAIFGLFVSVQGISSGLFDSVSIKATRFALSSSIPIVGGVVKDGFDFVVAGSMIIKNAVGSIGIVLLVIMVLSPIIEIALFSLILKLASSITGLYSKSFVPKLCSTLSKSLGYLSAVIIVSFIMFFVMIFLTVFSFGSIL